MHGNTPAGVRPNGGGGKGSLQHYNNLGHIISLPAFIHMYLIKPRNEVYYAIIVAHVAHITQRLKKILIG